MSEQSDAVVLIVSEESGALSLAYDSKLYYDLSPIEVTRKLKELLDKGSQKESEQQEIELEVSDMENKDVFVEH
jgi:diadenylate cyclase